MSSNTTVLYIDFKDGNSRKILDVIDWGYEDSGVYVVNKSGGLNSRIFAGNIDMIDEGTREFYDSVQPDD